MRHLRATLHCALLGTVLASGCRSCAEKVDQNLAGFRGQPGGDPAVAAAYVIACPDVIDLSVDNHPELSGLHPVGIDGRLDLEPVGRPQVEGQTVLQVSEQLAQFTHSTPAQIHVKVAAHEVQCVYLYGEVMGSQRAVPYEGHETVVDLLKRTGGITPEAAPSEVYVVRSHVSDIKRQEVFHVDLRAITLKHDERTNVRLEPFDQVHVGATERASTLKCMQPWLRPAFQKLWSWLPSTEKTPDAPPLQQ